MGTKTDYPDSERKRGIGTSRSAGSVRIAAGLAAVGVVVAAGCATMLGGGAAFSGTVHPQIAGPDEVIERTTLPSDHEIIGQVEAACTDRSGGGDWTDILLSDVLCSESRLLGALREKAAQVGGDIIVRRHCDEDTDTETKTKKDGDKTKEVTITTTHIECQAQVARPIPVDESEVGGEVASGNKPTPPGRRLVRADGEKTAKPGAIKTTPGVGSSSISASWRIRVRVTRVKGAPEYAPRAADTVDEVDGYPEGAEKLADIIARCEKECAQAAVRNGVREAGAKIGASAVVGVQCVADGEGWLCTGVAVAPGSAPRPASS